MLLYAQLSASFVQRPSDTVSYFFHMLVLPCAKALVQRKIKVTAAVVKVWWTKYKCQGNAKRIENAQMLEEQHCVLVAEVAREHPTAYRLSRALREHDPYVYISDGVAKQWLSKYGGHGGLQYVQNAGHLESWHGNRIREARPAYLSRI